MISLRGGGEGPLNHPGGEGDSAKHHGWDIHRGQGRQYASGPERNQTVSGGEKGRIDPAYKIGMQTLRPNRDANLTTK